MSLRTRSTAVLHQFSHVRQFQLQCIVILYHSQFTVFCTIVVAIFVQLSSVIFMRMGLTCNERMNELMECIGLSELCAWEYAGRYRLNW